jgi:DNA polymerase-1
MTKTLYLIDTYAQIFRSYFAIQNEMRSPVTGEPTQAVFGMTALLLKLLAKFDPDYVVAVIDAPGPTFRDALHDDYKGTRQETPSALTAQIPRILSLIDHLGIARMERAGLEADDVIACIARQIIGDDSHRDVRVRIASKDKDLLQLLGERVTLFDIQTESETDCAGLLESKGIRPEQVIDYLTLTGDTVDNVPGVPGIGPKTAAELLQAYGTLEGIFANVASLTPRRRDLLLTAREQTVRSRVLVTLRDDVDLGFTLDDARPRGVDVPAVQDLFREMGFRRFGDEILLLPARGGVPLAATTDDDIGAEPAPVGIEIGSVTTPRSRAELAALVARIALALGRKPGADPRIAPALALAMADGGESASELALSWGYPAESAYFRVSVETAQNDGIELAVFAEEIGPLLTDPAIPKVVHDGKAIAAALLSRTGLPLRGVVADTFIAAQMDECPACDLFGLGRDLLALSADVHGEALPPVVESSLFTHALAPILCARMAEKGMAGLLRDIEAPLGMEGAGILCDPLELSRQGEVLTARVAELKDAVFAAAGFTFDLNSPAQLGVALFERLGLPPGKKTKTGFSTDKEVLEGLADEEQEADPRTAVPRLTLEYRQLTKLLSTYLGNLQSAVRPATGRIHTTYRQLSTATGRLASDAPNLQNIPVRSDAGRAIRTAFHAPPGDVLLCADYSQVELRLLAHLSGDAAMIEAFRSGQDIHVAVAMEVFGVADPALVTREQRSQAKTINFGIVYGISAFGLARRIKALDRTGATALIARFRQTYSGIDHFLSECIDQARTDGYITTIAGRRRPIPEIRSSLAHTVALGERLAINTAVQGSAADLIKRAMVAVQGRIDRERLPARMLLQIHDELVFECDRDDADHCGAAIRDEMESAFPLRVPLVVSYGIGENWRDAK